MSLSFNFFVIFVWLLICETMKTFSISCLTSMRYSLLLVVTVLLTKTAVAGLGWTLEECKKHYGEPISTKSHPLGKMEYYFSAKNFYISVQMVQQDKAGFITYIRPSIDSDLVTALLKENASDATWRPQAMDKPNYHEWFGSEKGDAFAYTALLVTGLPMPNGKTGGEVPSDTCNLGTKERQVRENLG